MIKLWMIKLFARASVSLVLASCAPAALGGARLDAAPADGATPDTGRTDAGSDAGLGDTFVSIDTNPDVPPFSRDDAMLVNAVFPRALGCTARTVALVTFLNTGDRAWSAAGGFALVGGADPLAVSSRIELGDAVVDTGEMHEFAVPLAAGGAPMTATTRWQMTHDGPGAFGDSASQEITVHCDTPSASDFRLADVTIVSSPDVRPFAVTSRITSLSFSPGTIHIDHTLRGTWPPVVISEDGTEQEATIWVFFHIGGQWYATGGERLRPNQTDKALPNPSWIGNEWLYDPGRWGVMTGYVPSPGDLVGFMVVAGSTRSDDHVIVSERTGVVLVPFAADDVTTDYPPFAWEE